MPKKFYSLSILLSLILLVISCHKTDSTQSKEDEIHLRNFDIMSLPGWSKLINDTSLPLELKNSLNTRNYKFRMIGNNDGLWNIELKEGSFGFQSSRVVIANTNQGLSWIYLSYNYDKTVYNKYNSSTYNGTISVYNKLRIKTKALAYKKGKITSINVVNRQTVASAACETCEPDTIS